MSCEKKVRKKVNKKTNMTDDKLLGVKLLVHDSFNVTELVGQCVVTGDCMSNLTISLKDATIQHENSTFKVMI